ncbi:MAG: aspartate kinase [Lutimonas sp.]
MRVYKFGGASVKDAAGVRNVLKVLRELEASDTVVVISAMGKMTNAFESLVRSFFDGPEVSEMLETKDTIGSFYSQLESIRAFHFDILDDLGFEATHPVRSEVEELLEGIRTFLKNNDSESYDFVYDQIVSCGELISTRICSAFLNANGLENSWLDVRGCIVTNSDFRRARVDWNATCRQINKQIDRKGITLTQGFLGGDTQGNTTTLGREGSDYTAGIFAYCLEASEVSIFKDVPGVLNADPREFQRTQLLNRISYKEAIEMAFFGASVIHPKTLQPLQRKEIPLRVRSFLKPLEAGTFVRKGQHLEPEVPCFIVKKNQILLSVSDKEFHFVMEEDISELFALLSTFKMKVNMIQNSAISFSVCIEDNFNNFKRLVETLSTKYKVLFNKDLTLYTVRHFREEDLEKLERGQTVLLKQLSRETAQLVVREAKTK